MFHLKDITWDEDPQTFNGYFDLSDISDKNLQILKNCTLRKVIQNKYIYILFLTVSDT